MTRPRNRRSLRFENLESRNLLSSLVNTPTAEEQYMLELVNQARMNPQAAAQRLLNSIDPPLQTTLNYYHVNVNEVLQEIASAPLKAPLAWNSDLASAAQAHSQDMASNDFQSHTGSNGSSALDRIQQAGYANPVSTGENVYGYAKSVDNAMQAFLLDWGVSDQGHRRNIQQFNVASNDQYTDVGFGIVSTSGGSSSSAVGPMAITQDFGSRQNQQPQLVGVAYNDNAHSGFYAIGEGKANVQIDATNLATGQTTSTQTWSTGGFQMALAPGKYRVTASQDDTVIQSVTLTIENQNVQQDFLLNQQWDGRSVSQVETPITPANSQTSSATQSTTASISAPALATSTTSNSSSTSSPSTTSTSSSTSSSSPTSTSSSTSAASQSSTSTPATKSATTTAPASIPWVVYKPADATSWTLWKAQLS
jgi:uncharacterized protein YkwD